MKNILEVTFSANGFDNISKDVPTRVNTKTSTLIDYTLCSYRIGNNLYIIDATIGDYCLQILQVEKTIVNYMAI